MEQERKARRTKAQMEEEETKRLEYLKAIKIREYKEIVMTIPFIPPSVNQLYFTNHMGGRSLTKEGTVFKTRVRDHMVQHYMHDIQAINSKSMFSVQMDVYLSKDELITKGYLTTPGVKWPFRQKDIGNMEKIIMDCLVNVIMEDDSQIFEEKLTKIISPTEYVKLTVKEVPIADYINGDVPAVDVEDIFYKIEKFIESGNKDNT